MDQEKIDEIVQEMTGLCRQGAASAASLASSPVGKALYMSVLVALFGPIHPDHIVWWKP